VTRLSSASYLASIRSDTERMVSLLGGSPRWAAPVPSCPGWDLAALVRHVGGVHRRTAAAVTAATEHPAPATPAPDEDAALAAWLADGMENLVAALSSDPTTPAKTFDPTDQTVGFWQRRQTYETVIHRVDLEDALAAESPIASDVATDGVSEVQDLLIRLRLAQGRLTLPPYSIELHSTDSGATWALGTGELAGRAEATSEVLLRRLWHRPSAEPPHVTGHSDEVLAFLDLQLTA